MFRDDFDTVDKFIRLDRRTGKLFWRPRLPEDFSPSGPIPPVDRANNWNAQFAHKEALTSVTKRGYKSGQLWGKNILAHRAVFLLDRGYVPSKVDHIDGDRLNNHPNNLRAATSSQNGANRKPHKGARSRYKGVFWRPVEQKWVAVVVRNGRRHYLGMYELEVDAARAYDRAAEVLFGEFARINNA